MTATMDRATLRLAQRYIPKGSTEHTHPLGVCYTEDVERNGRNLYLVIAYVGSAGKRAFYESYRLKEQRDKRVAEFFSGLESSAKMRAEVKESRNRPHTVKVGDIIHHAWGYDQTQCDFYQVLAVTAHGATIQAIGSQAVAGTEGFMSERQTAVRDAFAGEPMKVRIDGSNHVTTLEHGSASLWDGSPKYCSWYA